MFSEVAYENTSNRLHFALPKRIQQGVRLKQEASSIQMTPVTLQNPPAVKKEVAFLGETQSMVEYQDAFGEHMHLQYAAVNQGGQREHSFGTIYRRQ